jgi:hypothetical protein
MHDSFTHQPGALTLYIFTLSYIVILFVTCSLSSQGAKSSHAFIRSHRLECSAKDEGGSVFRAMIPSVRSLLKFFNVIILEIKHFGGKNVITSFNIHRSVHRNIFLRYNQQDAPVI